MRLFNQSEDTDASEDEDMAESDDEDMEDHHVYEPIFVCKENGEIYYPENQVGKIFFSLKNT